MAIFAYGAFAISFAAAALTLWTPQRWRHLVPKQEVLDRLGYRAVVIGFPLDTMVLVLGAVWAEIAWGSYWSWDPKETASLVTWLIYGGYLHARVARGWTGRRAAWLLVIGFASVVLTFVGNAFFGGLHSYALTSDPADGQAEQRNEVTRHGRRRPLRRRPPAGAGTAWTGGRRASAGGRAGSPVPCRHVERVDALRSREPGRCR